MRAQPKVEAYTLPLRYNTGRCIIRAADAPHIALTADRARAEELRVSVGDIFSTLTDYVCSTYVNQFNKFGLWLQVYVQADPK